MGDALLRTLGLVTTSRADWGIYRPLAGRIRDEDGLTLRLLASGSHLSPEFGCTVNEIEAEGYEVAERVEMLLSSDTPEGIAKSMGLGVTGFAQVFGRWRPDILIVLGDRFEMCAAALAALPFKIPVAHIHGGELTEGAIDDSLRHSITKLSHLHFVATEEYGRRVAQLGEEPWRITVSGALGLDNLNRMKVMDIGELSALCGARLEKDFLLVTFHPVTLEYERAGEQAEELLQALRTTGLPVLFTMPNADTGGRVIRARIEEFCCGSPGSCAVENLGTRGYFSAMTHAAAMVGNSSSGILEAASFRLPVVNVGSRQRGRVRGANVIDCDCERAAIGEALAKALGEGFRSSLGDLVNPYGDGHAAGRIVARLAGQSLRPELIVKRFHDSGPNREGHE